MPQPQVVKKDYTVEITAAPDVKVRINDPPARFDQKGQLIKYTADERFICPVNAMRIPSGDHAATRAESV